MTRTEIEIRNARFNKFVGRFSILFFITMSATPAFAQAMVGQPILTFAANYIIGPLGVFAVVIGLAASIFRPDMVKSAIYAAVICAILFFVIKMAPQIVTAFKA